MNAQLIENKLYLAESFLLEDEVALLSVTEPEFDIEVVVLSVCGAGFGIAAELSDAKESLVIELSVASFFAQLMMNKTLIAKNNFFIIIYFWIFIKAITVVR